LLRAQRRSPPALVRFVLAVVQRMQRLEPFDRAMTLAAQAFTSIFPVVIVAFSVLPSDESGRLGSRVAHALALPAGTRSALSEALPEDAEQAATFGVLSLLIVLLSATSFSRALTRMYAKLWSVRGPGWRSPWRWIAAILAIAACTVAVQAALRTASGDVGWLAAALVLNVAVTTVLWTWVPSVLLAAEVPWRLLAPGGLIMGLASVATYFASRVYMPSALRYADRHYGELGVAFTSIGWLFCVAFVLILASVLGAAVATEPGPVSRYLSRRSPVPAPGTAPADGPLIPHE
jgi:membrane protein